MKRSAGTVRQLGPGRFQALGPSPDRTSLGVFPTYEAAEAMTNGAVDALQGDAATRMAGVTLRRFGERAMAQRAIDLPRSAQAERSRWKHVEAAPFIDDPADTLSAPSVDRWARALGRKLPDSASYILSLLSAVCGQAVREGLMGANPCAEIKIRRRTRTEDPWTYLVPSEQAALMAVDIPEVDLLQIGVLLGTGIRDGEMFSLRLADVHADAPEPFLTIRYGSRRAGTKGRKVRRVTLFGLGLECVRRWLAILPTYCPDNPERLAFPGPLGGFQRSGSFLVSEGRKGGKRVFIDRFRAALALAGIVAERRHDGRPVRPHDLRHTFAASLISGWWGAPWRIEDICKAMGHSSITVTQRYAHLAPGRVAELAAQTGWLRAGYGGPARSQFLPSKLEEHVEHRDEEEVLARPEQGRVLGPPRNQRVTSEAAERILPAVRAGDFDQARRVWGSPWSVEELVKLCEAAPEGATRKARAG